MRKLLALIMVVAMLATTVAGCGGPPGAHTPTAVPTKAPAAPTAAPTVAPTVAPPAPTAAPTAAAKKLLVRLVTDIGGIDDKSFNTTAYKGVQDAITKLGVDGNYLQSKQQTDYEKNIQEFVNAKADLIVTVGFLLGPATAKLALANPTSKFAIVDYTYP